MALKTIPSSNDILNLMVFYDNAFLFEDDSTLWPLPVASDHDVGCSTPYQGATVSGGSNVVVEAVAGMRQSSLGVRGRKKGKRRPRTSKNEEETERQRMTHIVVERNRRKQMNEHLTVLGSLIPEPYAQRGDQASIVGGAIQYVKELEHLLQSLEAQKLQLLGGSSLVDSTTPFSGFFTHPQNLPCESQLSSKYLLRSTSPIDDIEVTLIESHANLRILSRRRPRQLSRLVAGFQTLGLCILHLNVTTLDPLVFYSVSAKVEEGCQLSSVDDIVEAVHHMHRVIEQHEVAAASCSNSFLP